MQVTETVNDGLKREYTIHIDADIIAGKVQGKLLDLTKKIKMPGFRPGKVPLSLVKKNYNDSVANEVLEEMVGQTTQELIRDKNVRPALQPEIKIISYQEGSPLEYSVSLEVFPDIAMPDFSAMELANLVLTISDEDIDEGLKRLAEANKEYKQPGAPRPAALGDAVIIDFAGKVDGVLFDGGTADDFRLVLGSGQFIDGFEDQLVGMTEGEKKIIKVTFPEQYSANLAGKPAEFDVTVKEIQDASLPEINDEFAKKLGLDNVQALKDAIRERIEKDYQEAARTRLKKELFDLLEDSCDYPVPEGMVTGEFEVLWKQAQDEAAKNPDFFGKGEDAAREEYQKMAHRRVKLGLLLAEIGKTNNLVIGQDELRQSIYEQARQFPGQEHKVVEFYRKNPASLEQLKGPILEEKAVDFILQQITLQNKPVSSSEMLKMLEDENNA